MILMILSFIVCLNWRFQLLQFFKESQIFITDFTLISRLVFDVQWLSVDDKIGSSLLHVPALFQDVLDVDVSIDRIFLECPGLFALQWCLSDWWIWTTFFFKYSFYNVFTRISLLWNASFHLDARMSGHGSAMLQKIALFVLLVIHWQSLFLTSCVR